MSEPSPIIFSSPDAGSRSAGEALKRARESQGMTLEALAAMIKVTPAKLEALEQGRHDQLPDANFTRALAMTVCRALKMDPGSVLSALPAAKPTPLAEGKPPLNQPFKEAKGGAPLFDRNSVNWSMLLTPKYIAPAVLLIGALLIYVLPDSVLMPEGSLFSRQPEPTDSGSITQTVPGAAPAASETGAAPSSAAASLPASLHLDPANAASAVGAASGVAGGQAEGSALSSTNPSANSPALTSPASSQPVAADVGAALSSPVLPLPVPTAAPGTSSTLNLAVSQASWIEVKDAQGSKLFSRIAKAGENLSLQGASPFQVRIGNVSGVQLRFRGQPVDLGSITRNNVARLELK